MATSTATITMTMREATMRSAAQRGRVVDVREARESQPRQILGIAESSSCCSALIVPKDRRQDGLATSESDIARLAFCW